VRAGGDHRLADDAADPPARTKIDWSARGWTLSSGGRVGITRGSMARDAAPPTSRVDAAPVFQNRDERAAAAVPAATTFVCGAKAVAHVSDVPADRWSSCRPP